MKKKIGRPAKWTDAKAVAALKRLYLRLGRVPCRKELRASNGVPDSRFYYERFGSWRKALRRAGLKPRPCGQYIGPRTGRVSAAVSPRPVPLGNSDISTYWLQRDPTLGVHPYARRTA